MRPSPLLIACVLAGVACTNEAIDRLNAPRVPDGARFSASAAATETNFAGFIDFCVEFVPSKLFITPGAIFHLVTTNQNRWVTGNPLIDGVEHNAVLANINLKNGNGAAHLDVSLQPDAVNGTWEIRQTLTFRDGFPIGSSGVGHGTGDLQGMTIKFTTAPAVPVDNVCNPDLPGGPVTGVILSPASNG